MDEKLKDILCLMRDFVSKKHPDWKGVEGSFMVNEQRYDWEIKKG